MNTTPVVYAVIVSWNAERWICSALESLERSTLPVRIVVVDNASTDETVQRIRTSFKDVELLCMAENLGFAGANNHGIRYVLSRGADYILLLNQDAKVSPDTIRVLSDVFCTHREFGILSPLHLTYDGTGIDPVFFPFIKENIDIASGALSGHLKSIYEVDFVNAAIWLVSRPVFEKVGGFDPIFFMYGEDNDYCTRAQFHGFKIGVAPAAVAYHANGGISEQDMGFDKQCLKLTSQIIYRLKRPGHVFMLSCLGLVISWTQRSLIQMMDGDFKGLAATVAAFARGFSRLFPIWRHYRECRRQGPVWL